MQTFLGQLTKRVCVQMTTILGLVVHTFRAIKHGQEGTYIVTGSCQLHAARDRVFSEQSRSMRYRQIDWLEFSKLVPSH